jgi:serine/threonine protein phosphatase 1
MSPDQTRTFIIGDIHGCLNALETVSYLADIQPEDTLITLGDVVDRGPDSKGVIDWLIARHETGPTISLLGNHELLMMRARLSENNLIDWTRFGGRETLESYPGHSIQKVPMSHWLFLDEWCVDYHEEENWLCVHAGAEPQLPLSQQSELKLFWEKFIEAPKPHQSGKLLLCGHTAQKSGLPLLGNRTICLDTYCYGGGWLTAVELHSGRLFQARETGETRELAFRAPIP